MASVFKNYIFTHALFATIESLYSLVKEYAKVTTGKEEIYKIFSINTSDFELLNNALVQDITIIEALDVIRYLYKEFLRKVYEIHMADYKSKYKKDVMDFEDYYELITSVDSAYRFYFPYDELKDFYELVNEKDISYYTVNKTEIEIKFTNIYYKDSKKDILEMENFIKSFQLLFNIYTYLFKDRSIPGLKDYIELNLDLNPNSEEDLFENMFKILLTTVAAFIENGITWFWDSDINNNSIKGGNNINNNQSNDQSLTKTQIYKNKIFEKMFIGSSEESDSLKDILYYNPERDENTELEKYIGIEHLESVTSITAAIVTACESLATCLGYDDKKD